MRTSCDARMGGFVYYTLFNPTNRDNRLDELHHLTTNNNNRPSHSSHSQSSSSSLSSSSSPTSFRFHLINETSQQYIRDIVVSPVGMVLHRVTNHPVFVENTTHPLQIQLYHLEKRQAYANHLITKSIVVYSLITEETTGETGK
jgi:hypothetical protein